MFFVRLPIKTDILTAWLGSASVGVTSDWLGRRRAIAFGCIWGVIGGAIMAGAAHVAMCTSVRTRDV